MEKKLNLDSISLVFVLCFFSFNVSAQEGKPVIELKLYTNFAWSSSEKTIGFDTSLNQSILERNFDFELGYFSPAVSWATPKGNFHEIELSKLLFNQTDEATVIDKTGEAFQLIAGEINTHVFVALRYEYQLVFLKKKTDNRFKAGLAFGVRPFYSQASFDPKLSNSFGTRRSSLAASFSIVPRLKYDVTKKVYLDLNVPFNIAQLGLASNRTENPAIPLNQRTVTTFDFSTAPSNYLIRLGIGVRL